MTECNLFQVFLDKDPTLSDFREVLTDFDELIVEIEHLAESVKVGAIVLSTGKQLVSYSSVFISIYHQTIIDTILVIYNTRLRK